MWPRIIITIVALVAVLGASFFANEAKIREKINSINLPKAVSHTDAQKKIGFVNGNAEIIDIIPVTADLVIPAESGQKPVTEEPATQTPPEVVTKEAPLQFNLDVSFTSQAPLGIWDSVRKENCEEASVLMAYLFIKGEKITSPEMADAKMMEIVDWETKNFGYWKDTDAAKTAEILQSMFGLKNVEVKYDITLDDIRREVSQGYPIIIPAAGQKLGNPYFVQPGPLYHMLVIKGYTKDTIITNDPGTKRGKDFVYKNETLYNAIHDWNNGDVINGRKIMIVVKE